MRVGHAFNGAEWTLLATAQQQQKDRSDAKHMFEECQCEKSCAQKEQVEKHSLLS